MHYAAEQCGEAMIQSGRRSADRFHGQLMVAYVAQQKPEPGGAGGAGRKPGIRAKDAGRSTYAGEADPIDAIVEFARSRRITQLFIGHSQRPRWARMWERSPWKSLIDAAKEWMSEFSRNREILNRKAD